MEDCPKRKAAILVPTLNEAANLNALFQRLFASIDEANLAEGVEVLVSDGGSTDSTQEKVREWGEHAPVRLIESDGKRGLSGDILFAASQTEAEIVLVMDADLSHPPESVPAILAPLLAGTHDMVIGSRYVRGGEIPGWPWHRRLTSRAATLLTWPFVCASDPLSGFFAVKRDQMLELGGQATGFKLGLEILANGGDDLRVCEVPITFVDRTAGESKMGFTEIVRYLNQLKALSGGTASTGHAVRFALVGLSGLVVDLIVFNLLLSAGIAKDPAQLVSFAAATLSNFTLNSQWTFAAASKLGTESIWIRYLRFLIICILAAFVRGAVLGSFVDAVNWSPRLAILPAIATATVINFIGSALFVFPDRETRTTPGIRWRVFSLAIVGYAILIRLAFAGAIDLLPEEAYYWNYAQHLDIGYFDHPPMVAWLIWLSTTFFGHSEFAVRAGAIVCWFITAFFMFRLSTRLFGRTNGFRTLMLLAICPIYFATGFVMIPDASLYAAWAATLYFLQRALLEGRNLAWFGVGIAIGLGMLSKYTMALIGPPILLFIILDKDLRFWFRRPEPYLAVLIATALFTPVIIWNANHEWASFAFQGSRRWSGSPDFSLHLLIGSVVILLTPLGAVGAVIAMLPKKFGGIKLVCPFTSSHRTHLFLVLLSLIPFMVFLVNSLQNNPKLNWTGPVWLAILPVIAITMVASNGERPGWITRIGQSSWKPTAVGMMLLAGGGLYATTLGPPLIPELTEMAWPVAWEEMAGEIQKIEDNLTEQTGVDPYIVGFRDYYITVEYAFYDPLNEGVHETVGRGLFGDEGLMWDYWKKPASETDGSNMILVAFDPKKLARRHVVDRFERVGEIRKIAVLKHNRVAGQFYFRIGYGYSEK